MDVSVRVAGSGIVVNVTTEISVFVGPLTTSVLAGNVKISVEGIGVTVSMTVNGMDCPAPVVVRWGAKVVRNTVEAGKTVVYVVVLTT